MEDRRAELEAQIAKLRERALALNDPEAAATLEVNIIALELHLLDIVNPHPGKNTDADETKSSIDKITVAEGLDVIRLFTSIKSPENRTQLLKIIRSFIATLVER